MIRTSATAALGLDTGGTSTRAVVIDRSGRRLGQGEAGGGNLSSHDRDAAFTAIQEAMAAALAGIAPDTVGVGLIGTAGSSHFQRPDVAAELARRWAAVGLRCPYEIESDAVVAFCAGTDRPDGTLILSGTGALAAAMVDRTMSTTVDGHGWLLGDRGSAYWLGREAVVHALHTLDARLDASPLVRAVLSHYGIVAAASPAPREVQADLEVAVYRDAPVTLARLAPLVTSLVGSDSSAARIVTEGADHLLAAGNLVRSTGDDSPVVLAGSLLTTDTPLAAAVLDRVRSTWPSAPIGTAREGAAAAAWLGLIRAGLIARADVAGVHRIAVGY